AVVGRRRPVRGGGSPGLPGAHRVVARPVLPDVRRPAGRLRGPVVSGAANRRRVVGLDLSLTATGIAVIADTGAVDTKTVKTTSAAPMPDRIAHIAAKVAETVGGPNVLVVMEDCVLRSQAALGLAML